MNVTCFLRQISHEISADSADELHYISEVTTAQFLEQIFFFRSILLCEDVFTKPTKSGIPKIEGEIRKVPDFLIVLHAWTVLGMKVVELLNGISWYNEDDVREVRGKNESCLFSIFLDMLFQSLAGWGYKRE